MAIALVVISLAPGEIPRDCQAAQSALNNRAQRVPGNTDAVGAALKKAFDGCMDQHRRGDEQRAATASEVASAQAAKQSELGARDNARQDKTTQLVVQSLNVCSGENSRREALAAIAEEHRYAKTAGVTNLRVLEGAKDNLREADQLIATARATLRRFRSKPLPCGDRSVQRLASCYEDAGLPGCETDALRAQLDLFEND